MPYYVYIIKRISPKQTISYYTGYTNNPVRRYKEHHIKGCNKGYGLLGCKIIQQFLSRKEAMHFEKIVKKWPRAQKMKVYSNSDNSRFAINLSI